MILTLVAERYVTKSAKLKIQRKEPYRSGAFAIHEVTGNKAIFMYKASIVVIRVTLVALIISIIIIDTIK